LLANQPADSKTNELMNPVYKMQRWENQPFYYESCSNVSAFHRDKETGEMCCPYSLYCCPHTVGNCAEDPRAIRHPGFEKESLREEMKRRG